MVLTKTRGNNVLVAAVLCVVLSLVFSGFGLPAARADVVVDSIVAAPVTSGSIAAFTLTFHVQQDVPANAGHRVFVRFPASFSVPAFVPATAILLKGLYAPSAVTVQQTADGTVVGFDVVGSIGYPSLLKWEPVRVSILESAGIRLPATSGFYPVDVWTDVEPSPVRCNVAVQQAGGNGQSVTGLSVVIGGTLAAGKAAQYDLTFQTTAAGGLLAAKQDFVDIIFPEGTVVPAGLDPSSILVRFQNCARVEVDGLHLRAYVPAAVGFIAGGQLCSVTVLPRAGVLLPETPGNYALQAATSRDTSFVLSSQYTVTGTAVTGASVTWTPPQQGAAAVIEASFTTSPVGGLLHAADRIYLQLPTESSLPDSVPDGAIKVAGRAVSGVRIGTSRRLEIPVPVDVSPGTQVVVVVSSGAGIRNPSVSGVYPVRLSTSADTDPAVVSVTVTPSQIGRPEVMLTQRGAGAATGCTVTFVTGTGGGLAAGLDYALVRLPAGMSVPARILAGSVTVNGTPVQEDPVIQGSTVAVLMPVSVGPQEQVAVAFAAGAGLRNPDAAAALVFSASTSREVAWVESLPVDVTDLPAVKATVTPAAPDGQHSWYVSRPSVTFQASSAVDPSPLVYFQMDGGTTTRWLGQPIVVADGSHVLTFYAVDHQGQQGMQQSLNLAVDSVPPLVAIVEPQSGSVVAAGRELLVRGITEPGASVSVNGVSGEVGAGGEFSVTVELTDQGTLVADAVDPAGNAGQSTVTVTVDGQPPTLSITSPVPFQSVYAMPLAVTGTTEPGARVTIDGSAAAVQSDGRFSGTVGTLVEGANVITVVSEDAAGNATTRTVSVTYSSNRVIRMKIGSTSAVAGSDTFALPVAPVLVNGTTFVPLRFVGEAFGAAVQWDGVFRLIDISLGGRSIRLQIANKTAVVNGKNVSLGLAPFLQDGTTMVPIRFVSEVLGAQVVWDGATRTVSIFLPRS